MNELLENPKKLLKINDNYQESISVSTISRSDSKLNNYERSEQSQMAMVDILFSATNKISSHSRKRYDTQVRQMENKYDKYNRVPKTNRTNTAMVRTIIVHSS